MTIIRQLKQGNLIYSYRCDVCNIEYNKHLEYLRHVLYRHSDFYKNKLVFSDLCHCYSDIRAVSEYNLLKHILKGYHSIDTRLNLDTVNLSL